MGKGKIDSRSRTKVNHRQGGKQEEGMTLEQAQAEAARLNCEVHEVEEKLAEEQAN